MSTKVRGRRSRNGPSWFYNFSRPHPRLLGKTVYILGSGFSKPMGMPVIVDFIPEGMRMLKERAWGSRQSIASARTEKERQECNDLIERVHWVVASYDPMLRSLGIIQPTLEEIFCAVDLLTPVLPDSAADRTPRDILHSFVRLVCQIGWQRHEDQLVSLSQSVGNDQYTPTVPHLHFRSQARPPHVASNSAEPFARKSTRKMIPRVAGTLVDQRKQNVCAYEAFLSQIVADDAEIQRPEGISQDYASTAIISLNYDCVIEKKAESFGRSILSLYYGQNVVKAIKDQKSFRCLVSDLGKLHAHDTSVVLPLLKLHGSINWDKADDQGQSVVVHGRDLPASPQLILPTWQRDPIERTIFGRLLFEARIHLRLASRIVFIGYSMPPTDRYFRYLLADAMSTSDLPEIVICNRWKEAEARERCENMLGRGITESRLKVFFDFHEYVSARREPQVLDT